MFPRGRAFAQAGVFDRDSAAECHRHPDARPCPQQHDPGHSRAPGADAGLRGALAAGHRSCRHRHPDRRRETPAQRQKRRRGTISAGRNFSAGSWNGRTNMAASSSNSSSGSAAPAIGRGSATLSTRITSAPWRRCSSIFTAKGLIYRGRRMINWDPAAQTALIGRRGHCASRRRESFTMFAMRSSRSRGDSSRSRRRGRKRSWPIPRSRFIRTTRVIAI